MNKIAIYPGTFDPITLGHIDIIERARRIFDKLFVAIGVNQEKSTLFSLDERLAFLREATAKMDNVEVISFDGLLVELVQQLDATAIVRGMRVMSDFEYEFQLAILNRKIYNNAETIFLIPSEPYIFLNSTVVKSIAQNGGDVEQFVPKCVEEALKIKF
jgi:pantetheine-phosphate adenylyltransferase